MADTKDILSRESASRRQKILFKIVVRNPEYLTNELALRTALEMDGYFKVCSSSKESVERLLEFDLSQVKSYLANHHADLVNDYLAVCVYIKQQKFAKQQQLQKAVLTAFKLSWERMTTRVGMAARPRVEFQKVCFDSSIKQEQQNAVLDQLCLEARLGTLSRGRNHEQAAAKNAELGETDKPVRSRLSFLTIIHTDVVGEEFDIITYLVDLKLIPANMLSMTHLPVFKQFTAVMDYLTPGMIAFNAYCDEAGSKSALHRREVHQELLAAKIENREPEKLKREYTRKPAEKPSEPVLIEKLPTPAPTQIKEENMQLTWRELTDMQKMLVKNNKATFVAGEWEMRRAPQPAKEDLSWGFGLLEDEDMRPVDDSQELTALYERIANALAERFPAKKGAVKASILNYLENDGLVVKVFNSIFEIEKKGLEFTDARFLQGTDSFRDYIPAQHLDGICKLRDQVVNLQRKAEAVAMAEYSAEMQQKIQEDLKIRQEIYRANQERAAAEQAEKSKMTDEKLELITVGIDF